MCVITGRFENTESGVPFVATGSSPSRDTESSTRFDVLSTQREEESARQEKKRNLSRHLGLYSLYNALLRVIRRASPVVIFYQRQAKIYVREDCALTLLIGEFMAYDFEGGD